ncbi:hypothetical protein COY16_00175 [Candidatus Roizmanbacteria bacterium CG_4_10_14_0_2_um_filter_39_13]|uniref:Peptidase S9 prolyl oligopeptidase catalytic domain-containing protein n=1 Tax=Candidatus Roizmanbacteria bacterium CG_4_10_14_0_2_um_filter_39_13 TaxID=1974825 RepID=A0A2M7U2F4_9BACT|nr:MAG: hypothetical protein COY16_00175 [Candidatus Roizmanbacteria bacterium CG_4_10_14_0_2_um_filter_39_13]
MNTKLVQFLSTDNLRLPGLLYEPKVKTKKIALYLHGCGSASIFYSDKVNIFAKHLLKNNIAFFPFNNRGAHYIKTVKHVLPDGTEERVRVGTSYELIKDCVKDIDGAVEFLRKKGYETFYIFGESTGANKIVVYDHYAKNNPFTKYALLGGGDDTGLYYDEMGKKNYASAINKAKEVIAKGNGMKLVPKYISEYPFSYQALYDVLNPNGDYNIFPFNEYMNKLNLSKKELFGEFKKVNKKTLVMYGAQDEYCYGDVKKCVKILENQVQLKKNFTFQTIPNCGHGFEGKEEELATVVADFFSNS